MSVINVSVSRMGRCRVCGGPIEVMSDRDRRDILNGKLRVCLDCVGLELPKMSARKSVSGNDYLVSEAWGKKRDAAMKKAGYACQVCKSDSELNVYHNTYARFGHEANADLIVLCWDCYKVNSSRLPGDHPYRVGIEKTGNVQRRWGANRRRGPME